jgi:quercetin dioxygenase-like cupin family protein
MEFGQATLINDLAALRLDQPGGSAAALYDRPIGLRLLYRDDASGQEHYLIRYPAGVQCRIHRHTAAHTIVVLQGSLEANGEVLGPGSYAHFPAGQPMRHQPAPGGECLFVIVFHGPFDAEDLSR